MSPALERAVGDKLSSSGGARDALARWGTPTALRAAGKARVRTRIAKRSAPHSPTAHRRHAAVICVARRRCDIILAMLKTQTPYQPPQPQSLPQAA